MIYFIIVTLIIAGDKFLKEYFRSSLRGKHRKEHFNQSGEGINRVNAMQDGWRRLSPGCRFLENKGGKVVSFLHIPKILKGISGAMLCFCAFVLGKERQKGRVSIAGIGYALLLGGGLSNFIDRMKKGSVTDYIRFPEFPVKKISNLVFNMSDFAILQEYSAFCFSGKSKRISTEKSKTLGKMSDNKEYFQKMVKNGFSMRNG